MVPLFGGVTEFYPSSLLGLNEEQANGIVDPLATSEIEGDAVTESRGTALAKQILASFTK